MWPKETALLCLFRGVLGTRGSDTVSGSGRRQYALFFWVGGIGDGKRRCHGPWSSNYVHFMSHLQTDQNLCIYVLYYMFWGWSEPWNGGVGRKTLSYLHYIRSFSSGGFTVSDWRHVLVELVSVPSSGSLVVVVFGYITFSCLTPLSSPSEQWCHQSLLSPWSIHTSTEI